MRKQIPLIIFQSILLGLMVVLTRQLEDQAFASPPLITPHHQSKYLGTGHTLPPVSTLHLSYLKTVSAQLRAQPDAFRTSYARYRLLRPIIISRSPQVSRSQSVVISQIRQLHATQLISRPSVSGSYRATPVNAANHNMLATQQVLRTAVIKKQTLLMNRNVVATEVRNLPTSSVTRGPFPKLAHVITPLTTSLDPSAVEFGAAIADGTPMVNSGVTEPVTPGVLIPFMVNSSNVVFRVPGYVVMSDFDGIDPSFEQANGDNAVSDPNAISIQVQQLELDNQGNPIPDISDFTGYKWDNLGSPVQSSFLGYNANANGPPMPDPVWDFDLVNDIAEASGPLASVSNSAISVESEAFAISSQTQYVGQTGAPGAPESLAGIEASFNNGANPVQLTVYGLVSPTPQASPALIATQIGPFNPSGSTAEYGLAYPSYGPAAGTWDGSANQYTLDIPIQLNSVVNVLRFVIQPRNPNLPPYAAVYSGVVPVIVSPTALIQLKYLPILMIYQPPGDVSSVQYQSSQTVTTGFSAQVSNSPSQSTINASSQQVIWSGSIGFKIKLPFSLGDIGASLSGSTGQTWDNQTQTTNTVTNSTTESFSFTSVMQQQTQMKGYPSQGAAGAEPYLAPYWNDQILIAPHPQFAVWDFVPSSSQSNSFTMSMMALNSSDVAEVDVQDLAACAGDSTGNTIIPGIYTPPPGSTASTENLYQPDCLALLILDPFYVNGQSFSPPASLATPQGSIVVTSPNSTPLALTLTKSANTGQVIQAGSSTASSVDSTIGDSSSFGIQANLGNFANGSYGSSSSSSQQTGSGLTIAYTNQSSTSTTYATTANTAIADDGKTNQLPLHINYYFDNRFGTWMFQTDAPQTCYTSSQNPSCETVCENVTGCNLPCSPGLNNISECPAVGVNGKAMGASASCGDTIVIRGWGFTGITQVDVLPLVNGGTTISNSVVVPSFTVESDDLVTAIIQPKFGGNYRVVVSGLGFSNVVTVGTITIQNGCPQLPACPNCKAPQIPTNPPT